MSLVTFPANYAVAITKSDTVDIEPPVPGNPQRLTDAVWVGGAGVVVAVFENDSTAAFTCIAGTVLPVAIKRVNSTNTTATLMVALYRV